MNHKPLLKKQDYDETPFPNPNPRVFHGTNTEWPEEHDQKSLDKASTYKLRLKAPVPEGGKPFYVEQPHPSDGGDARLTMDEHRAKTFKGTYLLRTLWNWEWRFEAVS